MRAPSYAFVECTTSSANTAFDNSAKHVFDTDHGSVVFADDISDDITWNKTAGTFTFRDDGIYHIVANLITETASGTRKHTFTFNLNSDSAIYTAAATVPAAMDPIGHTHQRIISVSAGDVLHIKGVADANTFALNAGSSLVINRVTSDVYASSTVSTAGSNSTTDEFNPLDTDGDGPAFASTHKVANGITFTGNAGSMTVPSAGRYLIMVTNFHAATSTTNSNITIKLKEGTNVLVTGATRNNNATDPEETTIFTIEDLDADEVLTTTWDIGSGVCHADLGTTFTVYKLNDDIKARKSALDFSNFISVVSKAQSDATGAAVNKFDEDSYSSADFDTRMASGIAFASSTGRFTVDISGTYWVFYNPIITVAGDAVITMKILVNDTAVITAVPKIDSYNDPQNRSLTGVFVLSAGDYVTATVDSNSPNIQQDAGSSMVIIRMADWLNKESTAAQLIGDDFVTNTFAEDVMDVQHQSFVDQLPFILGTRGPISLRRRSVSADHKAPIVSSGGKKN
tara:strand:+ start:105 stop:1643 length:1539 start_codon:yes stop_codon:yes gene_type:complete